MKHRAPLVDELTLLARARVLPAARSAMHNPWATAHLSMPICSGTLVTGLRTRGVPRLDLRRWSSCCVGPGCQRLVRVDFGHDEGEGSAVNVRVEYVLDRPIDEVFAALADHANWKRFRQFSDSQLVEPGIDEPNGGGALRLLRVGRFVTFKERIIAFDRPTSMQYLVEDAGRVPLQHDKGEITLDSLDGKTRVVWISQGKLQIPLLGRLLDKPMSLWARRGFLGILKQIEDE